MTRREAGQRAYRSGQRAEAWCAWWLRLRGYRILARRHRSRYGEIDIIARRGKMVAFIEVKARPDRQSALAVVVAAQRQRIQRAASAFLANRPDLSEQYRAIRRDRRGTMALAIPHHRCLAPLICRILWLPQSLLEPS